MVNDIIKTINEFNDLKILSGPTFRKDRDSTNESGVVVKKGNEYYDCDLEYKGKRFPVTFLPSEDIRIKLLKILKENRIEI